MIGRRVRDKRQKKKDWMERRWRRRLARAHSRRRVTRLEAWFWSRLLVGAKLGGLGASLDGRILEAVERWTLSWMEFDWTAGRGV